MDELTLMRSFRAERVKRNPTARVAAWRALEVCFEPAPATPDSVATPARRRASLPWRGRRVLAFATAFSTAAVVAAMVLVLDSGPTAEPAAAQILHETAAVAASPQGPPTSPLPGPGQFYYREAKRLELVSWIPGGISMGGGIMTRPGTFAAQMPTTQQSWTAADGTGRTREVGGTPRFLTDAERSRWEAAGSRLPAPFDPEYQSRHLLAAGVALEARRGVFDHETRQPLEGFHFPDTLGYPTEPAALREVVESHRIRGAEIDPGAAPASPDTERAITGLFDILVEGNPLTPQLRAAVFNALAELPGIEVDTDATDFLGRPGYAIRSVDAEAGGGNEFIFDPATAEILAQREFLGEPGESPYVRGLPAGFTMRETAYLASGVVDSTRETPAEAEAGGPVATTGPTYRK